MDATQASGIPVVCPECGTVSGSVKCFRMGFVLFLGIGAGARWQNELGCPGCIRKKTLLFALVNLVSANVIWPILILPMTIAHLARSFQEGHSEAVLDLIRRS